MEGLHLNQQQKNEKKARLCLGCIYLHIGTEVDHNHCDKEKWCRGEKRANGLLESNCPYKYDGKPLRVAVSNVKFRSISG